MTTLWPFLEQNPRYRQLSLLERLEVEPERVLFNSASCGWTIKTVQVNRAWRVQFNSAIGPFKGGMRSIRQSICRSSNSLVSSRPSKMPSPPCRWAVVKAAAILILKGKLEVMRFCQSLMTELYRHLGPDTDVPAGDMGVGAREVGFMAGMMKKLSNNACVTHRQRALLRR